ncbi:hypothetical protein SSX86_025346 [Deinandra increscens subsp. villosa]|uniref:TMEM205-like domain-containing protein n=1 Tax=Deinandra increscens subsp. villosa TaxID=3103831 RepID=A0AAP0GLB3_9ASTR
MNKYLAILIVLTSLLTTKTASSPSDGLSPQEDVLNPKQTSNEGTNKPTFSGPRDLICDAYGKCTHKIANVLAKTREKVAKTAHRVSDKARELAGDAADIVRDGASKDFDVIDSPKRMGEDIAGNATDEIAEHVSENAKGTVKNIQGIGQVGERSLEKFLFKLKDIVGGDKMDANSVGGLIHMVGFSTAYGMCVWVTFVSSYILGRCLPREMFGMVQRRMYRVYFKAMGYCVFAAFLGHLVSRKGEVLSSKMGVFQSLCLVSALLMVMSNVIFLEPKATKAMYERMKLEKEEGRGVGFVVAAKDGMMDGMMDGASAKVVRPA